MLTNLYQFYGAQLGTLAMTAPIWVNLSPDSAYRDQVLGNQAIADVCEKYL